MGLFGTIAKIGGFAAAPFTGGASIPIGLGIGGAFDAASQQGKANEASQQALDFARQDIAARQPFRDQLFASLQQGQPQRQDLGNLFQSANPFAQPQAGQPQPQGQPQGLPQGLPQSSGFPSLPGGFTPPQFSPRGGQFNPVQGLPPDKFLQDQKVFGGRF